MPTTADPPALATARAYLDAWRGHEYERAAALLSGDLEVEVPINEYPTKQSFAAALTGFGQMVERVDLLAAMGDASEAMLLYDMQVSSLGTMRIVEHFTVDDGQITRLRQIHDTAAIRETGLSPVSAIDAGFSTSVPINASSERVFDALTTLEGLRGWWTPAVSGSARAGGELRFRFDGVDELIRMRVDAITPPKDVSWTCLEHSGNPGWTGSTVRFRLGAAPRGCTLSISHVGIPAAQVRAGWEHFLSSIRAYVETGAGQPYLTA